MHAGKNRHDSLDTRRLAQDGDIEVTDFPQDVTLDPDHSYVSVSGRNVIIDRMFDACMKVPDVYRYKIENDGNLSVQRLCQDKDVREECDLPTIVLLLESPHRDEYRNNRPCAPAMGATGRNLDSHLCSVLSCIRHSIRNGSSRIILSNPVQFQTSLHMILHEMNREVRDAVWNALWCHPYIRSRFESRMRAYNPYIIINACTGGRKPEGLRRKVSDFLQQAQICGRIYKGSHPSGWWSRQNRRLVESAVL